MTFADKKVYIYIYIYIYVQRERQRQADRDRERQREITTNSSIYRTVAYTETCVSSFKDSLAVLNI